MTRRSALLGLLVFAATAALAAPSTSGARSNRCDRPGYITLLRNSHARVFRRRRSAGHTTYACLYRTGQVISIDDPSTSESWAYGPPAMALTGPLLAYGLDGTAADGRTVIRVDDLRRPFTTGAIDPGGPSEPTAKIGSVVVKPDGAVAWITCPDPEGSRPGTPAPTCVHAGAHDYVYAHDAGTGPYSHRLLAQGTTIAPASLSRHGSKICWRDDKRRVCGSLH